MLSTLSQETAFGKRHRRIPAYDEVVQNPDVDERERVLEGLRERLVRPARFGNARGVIVREDDGRGIEVQRAFHDFARKHARLRERPRGRRLH